MEHLDVAHYVSIILDGSNYPLWAQAMTSFLKGKKYWPIITVILTQPSNEVNETQVKSVDCLDDWDNKNNKIIT